MNDGINSRRTVFENDSIAIGAAATRCSVEVAISVLYHAPDWIATVAPVGKFVKRRVATGRDACRPSEAQFIYGASIVSTSLIGDPVNIAIRPRCQAAGRIEVPFVSALVKLNTSVMAHCAWAAKGIKALANAATQYLFMNFLPRINDS